MVFMQFFINLNEIRSGPLCASLLAKTFMHDMWDKEISNTVLVLIPKTELPKQAFQFRPNNLCAMSY